MIPVSNDYHRQLNAGNRRVLIKIPVYLSGNTSATPDFTLTNEHIWDNGVSFDSATSNDSSFDIGTAIVGSLSVVIDNINEEYSQYDFYDAKLVLWLGIEGDVDGNNDQRYYRIGFYVVDSPTYNGSLITLNCLDNMAWFDVPFDEVTGIVYPTTAGALVGAICSHVGVTLGSANFPNYTTPISAKPEGEYNCREILQYVAQICCCYCKIGTAGQLLLQWYDKTLITGISDVDGGTFDTNTTPYSDGDSVNGGTFSTNTTPYSDGDDVNGGTFTSLYESAYLSHNFDMEVSTEDIVVTGCRVKNDDNENGYDELWVDSTLELTHERYVLVIDNNPFVNSTNAATIASTVGLILAGLPIRGFTATSLSDFAIETGDMATIIDFRGNRYYTWITHLTYTTNNSENFSCGVESVRKRKEQRFSEVVHTLAEAAANAKSMLTEYDTQVKALNELAYNSIGYNEYVYIYNGAKITWRYNGSNVDDTDPLHPKFQGSTVVFMISGDGVFISNSIDPDGTVHYTDGYDANTGTALLKLIYTIGLSFNWAKGGTLTLGGFDNLDGVLSILNASNVEKIHGDNTGIAIGSNGASDSKIKLTTSGSMEYYYGGNYSGEIHMSAQNYGTEQNPDIRDTLTLEDFYDICLRSESGKSHIHLWTDESSGDYGNIIIETTDDSAGHGEVSISSRYDDGDTFRDVELLINSLGIHLNGQLVAGSYNAIDAYPAIVESDGSIYDYDFNNGILTGRTLRQGSTFPHSVWHSWSSGDTTYVAIILGVGVTQAVFPDCTNDEHHAYDPYIECASNVSPPKITDMVTNGTTITVTFTAVTSQQAGSGQTSLCVIKLMEHIL